jgi:YVTN family beta-propeller protein
MRKPLFTTLALGVAGALLTSCGGTDQGPGAILAAAGERPQVVITPSEATLPVGETRQFEANLVDPSGRPHPEPRFTWSSSNSAVATVSSTGLVTAVAQGSATIAATIHPFSGTAVVTVVRPTHPEGVIAGTVALDSRPWDAAVSSRGTYHVSRLDAAAVARGDLPDFGFTASIAAGSVPTNLAFHPSGSTSYVTNQFSQNIGVIDVAANTQVSTVLLQGDAFEVAASPDGRTVYASDNANHLYAIDAATGTIRATLTVSSICNGLVFNPSGTRVYASLLFSGEIVEIDAHDDAVIRNMPIGGGKLQKIAISTDGSELYVADEAFGLLRVVSVESGTQIAEVPLSGGGFGVALSPDNAQVYVSILFSGVVQVVDRASRSVVKSIVTGGEPRGIAFSPAGETAVIANESGWVDFIR